MISAILLSALGVRDELIVADYALSQQNLDAIIERLNESEGYKQMFAELPPDTLHAEPETMVALEVVTEVSAWLSSLLLTGALTVWFVRRRGRELVV